MFPLLPLPHPTPIPTLLPPLPNHLQMPRPLAQHPLRLRRQPRRKLLIHLRRLGRLCVLRRFHGQVFFRDP